MKHLKKILALALIAVSLFTVALPVLASALQQHPKVCINPSCKSTNIRHIYLYDDPEEGARYTAQCQNGSCMAMWSYWYHP